MTSREQGSSVQQHAPTSELASKTEGFWNVKVAVPEEPSLLRVSLTSGMEGSSTPLMNSSFAAIQLICSWLRSGCRAATLLLVKARTGRAPAGQELISTVVQGVAQRVWASYHARPIRI